MKRVLVAPLDWGLGHATRCIPIIRELLNRKCEVIIAGSGASLLLLKAEFPTLKFFSLTGYDPKYPVKDQMVWKMLTQLPRFLNTINTEHTEIEDIIQKNKIDVVISDNRYGCWSKNVLSVFITHQSNILMPKRFGWLQGAVKRLNESMMKKFTVCWLPDFPGQNNLAGDLISFGKLPPSIKAEYIGSLSRFVPSAETEKKFDVTAIFSGPEPQRTLLEKCVMAQLRSSTLKYFIVRGLPSHQQYKPDDCVADFLTSRELLYIVEASACIIARSGYSTVMDMAALNKKVIFIPTPGQTEQEYLAKRLKEKRIAFSMSQNDFNLEKALQETEHYSGFTGQPGPNTLLGEALDKILKY